MINLGNSGDFIAIIIGDPHVTGQNPVSRKDNLPETILKKMKEVIFLARDLKADMMLSVGDLFHTPDPSNITKGKLGALLNLRPCDFYTLAGNHDLFGGNMQTYERTGLGLLEKMGSIKVFKEEPLFFKKGNIRFQVTGQNYHNQIDKRNPELDYCRTKAEGITHSLHMAHGYLTDKKLLFSHTMIDRIQDITEADVTISGHLHTPFRKDINGKIFANPGALPRLSASKGEMRRPKVFILRITQEGVLTLEDYYLKTAHPFDSVLDRSHLEEDFAHQQKMIAFIDGISELTNRTSQNLDIYDIIEEISREENIDTKVKDSVLSAISDAEAEIQSAMGGRD